MAKIREATEPPPLPRAMGYGMRGPDVLRLQQLLQASGHVKGTPMGNFLARTREAVKYFQGTHIGEDGQHLVADGVVGAKTWWAVHNPHGTAQENGMKPPAPDGVDRGDRGLVVRYAYTLHQQRVREAPDGSNYGDGVTPIANACGFKYGIPWCMAFVSYVFSKAIAAPPLGAMHVGCSTFWNTARRAGMAHTKGTYAPTPGDIGIYNYGGGLRRDGQLRGAGHATLVVGVAGHLHNTVEGNAGNRCKHALRNEHERDIDGDANPYGDTPAPGLWPSGVQQAPRYTLTYAATR